MRSVVNCSHKWIWSTSLPRIVLLSARHYTLHANTIRHGVWHTTCKRCRANHGGRREPHAPATYVFRNSNRFYRWKTTHDQGPRVPFKRAIVENESEFHLLIYYKEGACTLSCLHKPTESRSYKPSQSAVSQKLTIWTHDLKVSALQLGACWSRFWKIEATQAN